MFVCIKHIQTLDLQPTVDELLAMSIFLNSVFVVLKPLCSAPIIQQNLGALELQRHSNMPSYNKFAIFTYLYTACSSYFVWELNQQCPDTKAFAEVLLQAFE